MNEDSRIIPSGPLKGKKIEFAPTTGIDRFFGISKEFMKKIFDFDPGEYLISDESSLSTRRLKTSGFLVAFPVQRW
jgi:hypothetical protein